MKKASKVSVIIPAFNEEKTIVNVIRVFEKSGIADEIIVVDDGSSDRTGLYASLTSARVVSVAKNMGKGAAMELGVSKSRNNLIFFADADAIGLNAEHVRLIVSPVCDGSYDMFVGIKGRKISCLFRLFAPILPLIGGERVLTKRLWYAAPSKFKSGFSVEIALNYFARRGRYHTGHIVLDGVSHVLKAEKYGFFVGGWRRLKMIIDFCLVTLRLYVMRPQALAEKTYQESSK